MRFLGSLVFSLSLTVAQAEVVCPPLPLFQLGPLAVELPNLIGCEPLAEGGFIWGGWWFDTDKQPPETGNSMLAGRYDAQGHQLWQTKVYGGRTDALGVYPDGGSILAGYTTYPGPGYSVTNDFWTVRLDPNGRVLWQTTCGGSKEDYVHALAVMPDGGCVLAGSSLSPAGGCKTSPAFVPNPVWGPFREDYWVVRLNAQGLKLWETALGGVTEDVYPVMSNSGRDIATQVEATPDGGCIVGGISASQPSGNKTTPGFGQIDVWLVRLDAEGSKLWETALGGIYDDRLGALQVVPDGGCIVAASSQSPPGTGNRTAPILDVGSPGQGDYWVVRLDSLGREMWQHTYGGAAADVCSTIALMPDGGFLFGGYSASPGGTGTKTGASHGSNDWWMVRTDGAGFPIYDLCFGGPGDDRLLQMRVEASGEIALLGPMTPPFERFCPGCNLWTILLSPETCDSDHDGVSDDLDVCPDTPPGAIVDVHGCSLDQLCPCTAPWRNHGEYVNCVKETTAEFVRQELISEEQRKVIVRGAARSDCGK